MRNFLFVVSIVALGATSAVAQENTVGTLTQATGQVTVARGGQTYTLAQGNQVLAGDRILTGSGAGATITYGGCTVTLTSLQSVVVNEAFCTTPPVSLGQGAQAGGAGVGGGVGATPAIALAGLLGGAAALSGDGGSSSP